MKQFYVYILASKRNGTLYTGCTADLIKRVWEHKNKVVDSFTKKYSVCLLVYFEIYDDIYTAMKREFKLKRWKRRWKIALIEKENPGWRDLYGEII